MMASSSASTSSALVRNPFLLVSSTIFLDRSVPLAQPLVTVARRAAASAITRLISCPRANGVPPSFWPEPALNVRRFSAAARAWRCNSCNGILLPPPSL